MGREIRRVPEGWEHPRDERGNYKPLYDQAYEDACKEWKEGYAQWERGEHPYQSDSEFWDGWTSPPNEDYYRSTPSGTQFNGEPTHYQIYQTVSEGSPVSPKFVSLEQLVDWLVEQGTARSSAEAFAKGGWAPSMVVERSETGQVDIKMNYDAL